jgi:hypothetical protein
VLRGILQRWANLVAVKTHVAQLPIAETAQHRQTSLVFALGDESRDPSIDETEKPSADGAEALSSGKRAGIAGAAVQQGHRILLSVAGFLAACRFPTAKAFRDR